MSEFLVLTGSNGGAVERVCMPSWSFFWPLAMVHLNRATGGVVVSYLHCTNRQWVAKSNRQHPSGSECLLRNPGRQPSTTGSALHQHFGVVNE